MRDQIIGTRLIAIVTVVLIASGIGPPIATACETLAAYNGSDLIYARCRIPDCDQRRAPDPPFTPGLPGIGNMYCAPTSAVDVMAYLATQGFPTILPGPGYWGPEVGFPPFRQYNTMTSMIQTMGVFMGTSATDGTYAGPATTGIKFWLSAAGVGNLFTVNSYTASGFYSPIFA